MRKFYGDFRQLLVLFKQAGIMGEWRVLNHRQWQFRAITGAIFNFWPTTGTVNFQGLPKAAAALEACLKASALRMRLSGQRRDAPIARHLPAARPISLSASPRCQQSQISALSAAVTFRTCLIGHLTPQR